MTKINWHRQHKWSGIAAAILLLLFCLSGIVLNHRDFVSDCELSRRWLPSWYEFKGWNGGLLRGTVRYNDKILIYGSNGVWITDSVASSIEDFNAGIPDAADHRQIKGIAERHGVYYAVTPEALYRLSGSLWKKEPIEIDEGERLSDIAVRGDSLVVVGRSNLYLSSGRETGFLKVEVPAEEGSERRVSLFKAVWMLHSGELFGVIGKIIVDMIAGILIFISLTGLVIWLIPKEIRIRVRHHRSITGMSRFVKCNFSWHNKIGGMTILLTLLIAVTGWCLRPPMMIPLALTTTRTIPGTTLDNENPWHDKLRMIRYDNMSGEWLLSTSDGFYVLDELTSCPERAVQAPPVSVMGLNVWERDSCGVWICGSFSGLYRWYRNRDIVTDYFTGKVSENKSGPPFGKFAASGYSREFNTAVEYYAGTNVLSQPDEMKYLPMSLWGLALEAHSGRLFLGSIATYVFIFFTGLVIIWSLWSGWKVHQKR